ncbi:hypothetical protein D3C81_1690910 [compost metagenome]
MGLGQKFPAGPGAFQLSRGRVEQFRQPHIGRLEADALGRLGIGGQIEHLLVERQLVQHIARRIALHRPVLHG